MDGASLCGKSGRLRLPPAQNLAKAAVDGALPRGFGVSRLIDLPAIWKEQRRLLGLADTKMLAS
jgi:hypothetical protein